MSFIGDDSEPENFFPTFHIYNMNECLSLWTGDAQDYMLDINSEMCLTNDLEGPEINQDVIRGGKKDTRYKLITNYQVASFRVKIENTQKLGTL